MNNLIFTQLSIPEIRQLFRDELQTFFGNQNRSGFAPAETNQLLNLDQAAVRLSLAKSTLYTLNSRRVNHFCKVSKSVYYSTEDLNQWIQSGRKRTNQEISEAANTYIGQRSNKIRRAA
ncbi:helix-turn-helix domain-containing protein [uncultured Mucilaginibacter sp.]|uniref:helix-turn-helix domain-containing protein n=1 Tax=uncultured Mucilaginibacter sp. TaxID=797541 RepID=UPI0025CE9191|nr:helix-turn-helix domain-containing protein [uncultured Mucilaginibacter sp.]